MDRWTDDDEIALNAMLKRKQVLHDQYRNALINFARRSLSGVSDTLKEQMVDWMIRNADEVRNLMKPFFNSTLTVAPSEHLTHER